DVQSGFDWQINIDDELRIYADKEKLSSVFQNLIENAIKYSAKNTLMYFSAEEDGEWLKMNIRDNGPGVDNAYLPSIFNKFYRVPGAGDVKGFGLGLYRVAGIVKAHGGTVTAENKEGLSFMISLPLL
ncbi:MAG: sensor histidine kinase, partial [Chitinophagaceae bacterium]|nr:sensor histidine kinase [Chitinophagaceae bacterium]